MLAACQMARSTFYYHTQQRNDKYAALKKRIREIYTKHKGRYGVRRIYQTLLNEGYHINHKTVQRLMFSMDLKGITPRRHYHSFKGEIGRIAPNIIERNFVADGPGQKGTTDISQVTINGTKLYLSALRDMWNNEIISWTISTSPNMQLVMQMLHKAYRKRAFCEGSIMHSDQGWHYQNIRYRNSLQQHGITQSMSRKGNCLDNAIMENFFSTMKNEFYYVNQFDSVESFIEQLRDYIHYYNHDRIVLRLKTSPVNYRKQYMNNSSNNNNNSNNSDNNSNNMNCDNKPFANNIATQLTP